VVHQALPAHRRRWAEGRVGLAQREGLPSAEQVKLLLITGERQKAAQQANTLAAEHLRQRRYREAIQLLEPFVEALQREEPAEAGQAAALLARALQASRPTDPATPKALSRARALAGKTPALQASLELATAQVFVGIGHYRNFRKHLMAAWEHAERTGDLALRAEIAGELGRSYRLHAELPAAESWFEQSYQLANQAGDLTLAGRALVGQAGCLRAAGRIAEGEARASRALNDLQWTDDKAAYWLALATWTDLLRVQGRYTEALSLADQQLPAASQTEDRRTYLRLLIATAWCEVDLRRLGRAQELVEEILANLPRGEHPHIRLEAELLGAALQLASGQAREASWSLQDSLTRARRAELTALAAQLQALLAEAQLDLGQPEASEENWREALLNLLGSGELTVTAEFAARRARSAHGQLDPARLFRPVARLLQEAPLEPIRIDRDLARVAWLRAHGEAQEARRVLDEALRRLQELMGGLGDTERAALRTHPWSAALRRSLS
jgi:tetratricopeptide (TPR) repeat protein